MNLYPDLLQSLPLQNLVTLGFLLTLGLYAVFSFIMYYHWNEYSVEPKMTSLTLILYFISTLPLLLILGIMTLII